jgi:hypothetical protein
MGGGVIQFHGGSIAAGFAIVNRISRIMEIMMTGWKINLGLLALGGPERASCADVHRIASAHLASVRSKLSGLVKLETILAETVAQCSEGATPDCPVLDILDAGRQSD